MSLGSRIGAYLTVGLMACAVMPTIGHAGAQTESADCRTADIETTESYGAQLYTVRLAMERDFEASLCRIARIGYREVEFAGLYGRDPDAVRVLLHRYSLKAVAAHADWRELRNDPLKSILSTKSLGARYLVLAWLPPEERTTIAQWRWWIEHLNNVGKMAAKEGIGTLYHAHDFEYQPIDGMRPIDLLQQQLDPRYVNFEMDIYWTVKGGGDPVALLRQYPGRFPLAHIKDMQTSGTGMADVGDGRIDFAAIFSAADKKDFLHKFVERDEASEPFDTLRRSLVYLKSIERKPTP